MNRMSYLLRIMAAALVLACVSAASQGQAADRIFRIGFVALVTPGMTAPWMKAFREELRGFGYEEGRNLLIEQRFANGNRDQLKDLVAELAGLKVDAFLTAGEPALLAAKAYGGDIPIVTVTCDPLDRLVKSLARPGGRATGFTCISSDLGSKRLGLLKSILPGLEHLAVLYSEPDNLAPELDEVATQARQLAMEAARYPVRSAQDFAEVFRQMADRHSGALYILSSSFANLHRAKLAELALEGRLPAMYGFREFPEAGGLMSYGASIADGFRSAAHQIDKILKGASPADVPVQQPTRFELVVNMKTAKALGLEIPAVVLVQADELIE
jgi:putative ABC transport system substrate-binding protein